jgi:hypothetical protein
MRPAVSNAFYKAISERYGFNVPNEYRHLASRGLLSITTPAHASAFHKPGSYLWLHDMEWYSLQDIADFEFQSYHLPGFVPFAFTGGGDYWCWQPAFTDERGTRVLCCHRDSEFAIIYAPNFQTALFRQTLDFSRSSVFDVDIAPTAFLNRWAIDFAEIFPTSWCAYLRQLAVAEDRGELAASIEKTEVLSEDLDAEVRWMRPTPRL